MPTNCVTCRDWGKYERHEDHWPPDADMSECARCHLTYAEHVEACASGRVTAHMFQGYVAPDEIAAVERSR